MGTSLNLVLINDPEQRFDPKDPQHDPERAIRIARDLGCGDWEHTGSAVLELGMNADHGEMFITAGAHGVIISSQLLWELAFAQEGSEIMERMRRHFPDSETRSIPD